MIKKRLLILGIFILIVFPLATILSCKGKEKVSTKEDLPKGEGRAISLKVIQRKVEECMAKENCPEDILQLYGVKKVLGYVIDERNRDIILIGKVDDTSPPLYLEDFVLALRNTWMKYAELKGNTYYYSNPGCSIDPDPRVWGTLKKKAEQIFRNPNPNKVEENLKQWNNVCQQPQQVRVLGIPYDTRFGKVMVEADYYMKRLVDGSVTLDIEGFISLTDMTLNIARNEIEESKPISVPLSSLNRFWFFPGENTYLEDKGVIYIKKSDVILLTEEQFLTKRGDIAGTGRPNPLADEFAKNFSVKYYEIAKKKPIYAELEGLFRFVAVARIMKYKNAIIEAGINIDYLLNEYPVRSVYVDRTLPGISNVKKFEHRSDTTRGYSILYLWLPSCGGVGIDINISEANFVMDKTRSLAEIKTSVLDTRPSPDSLYWDFPAMWIVKLKSVSKHSVS